MVDAAGDVLVLVEAVDDLVRDDVPGTGVRAAEALGEAEEAAVGAAWHAVLAVALQHQLVDQAELVVEVLADVPVHAEERVTAHLDAHRASAHGNAPQHRHHVGAAEAFPEGAVRGPWNP
ncbi:hypothetical protein ACPC54_07970 [Kitasatospora sp. NPDC094028]